MKKLTKKTENRFNTVGAFKGERTACRNTCSCTCTSQSGTKSRVKTVNAMEVGGAYTRGTA